mmetsp:Transcript_4826/g.10209  ORF Transcript_4826/g.10209 Transcript_4826/m.10209 type:complete len:284 (-) Transcript_4826:444-1295(-)
MHGIVGVPSGGGCPPKSSGAVALNSAISGASSAGDFPFLALFLGLAADAGFDLGDFLRDPAFLFPAFFGLAFPGPAFPGPGFPGPVVPDPASPGPASPSPASPGLASPGPASRNPASPGLTSPSPASPSPVASTPSMSSTTVAICASLLFSFTDIPLSIRTLRTIIKSPTINASKTLRSKTASTPHASARRALQPLVTLHLSGRPLRMESMKTITDFSLWVSCIRFSVGRIPGGMSSRIHPFPLFWCCRRKWIMGCLLSEPNFRSIFDMLKCRLFCSIPWNCS